MTATGNNQKQGHLRSYADSRGKMSLRVPNNLMVVGMERDKREDFFKKNQQDLMTGQKKRE